jgi:LAGLIDADG DNA endonuclease family protein
MQRTSAPPCGYSGDTEILTRTGWVKFPQLTYMSEVATRSPSGAFEWQYPERITCQPYEGEMVWLHSRTTDSLVTPGHTVRYLRRQRVMRNGKRADLGPVESAAPALSLIGGRWPLLATSRWEPQAPRTTFGFISRPVRTDGRRNVGRPPAEFHTSADDFAAFMGMYLAEGNLGTSNQSGYYRIDIWQKYLGRGFREYQDLLNRLLGREVPHKPKKGLWDFRNKALYEFLKTCGGYAWTKRIPPEVLDLPAASLEKFWQFYALGDGTVMESEGRKPVDVISTTSPQMAGELQEVLQKLGGWSLIQIIDTNKYEGRGRGRKHLTHRLIRRAGTVAFASKIERIPYCGPVGNACVGGRAVYVRRNNRPVWSGMS